MLGWEILFVEICGLLWTRLIGHHLFRGQWGYGVSGMGAMSVFGQCHLAAKSSRGQEACSTATGLILTFYCMLNSDRYRVVLLYGSSDDGKDLTTVTVNTGESWVREDTAYVGKGLVASSVLTNVRFLSSMRPRMHGQCTPLDKTFTAIFDGAMVRSLVGVYPKMPAQVCFASESLLASARGNRFSGTR